MATRNTTLTIPVIVCLFFMSISSKTDATTLSTPPVQLDQFWHYYLYDPDPDWWDPAWGPYPDYTIISDSLSPSQNGPSFFPDSVQPYYDSLTLSLTAGPSKKFVVDVPTGLSNINMGIHVLFSLVSDDYVPQIPSTPEIMPDYQSITLLGLSGETIMSSQDGVSVFVSESGSDVFADVSLLIEHHIEFSSIELTCRYNGGIPYPLHDGYEYAIINKVENSSMTYISSGDYYSGWYPDAPILSIVAVPEPGTCLLLGLGGILLRRYRPEK